MIYNKKMIKATILGVALLAVAAALLPSCKKQLDAGPIDGSYGAVFWTSQANVEEATEAMYAQLRVNLNQTGISGEGGYFVRGDLVSSNFTIAGGTYDQFLPQFLPSGNFDFNYTPYWDFLQDWSGFYTTIALCNEVLLHVPQMPSSLFSGVAQQNAYIAEAYFVRAYTYFYMCEVWGDPVYVAKTFDDVDYGHVPPIPRTPTNAVLDSCLADLRIAQNYLPYAGGDPTKTIRANKGSVQALMANMFAWEHQYDSTHYYCQQIINNGGYALEPMATYANIWKGMASNESIFELPMLYQVNDPNFRSGGSYSEASFSFFATFLKGPIVNNQKSQCWLVPPGGVMIPAQGSPAIFDTVHDARFSSVFTYSPASNGDPSGYMLEKYTAFLYQQPNSNPSIPGNYPYLNNDLVLLRLADIYLLDAEALAYKGNLSGAATDLSFTEGRAGINSYSTITNPSDMLDEVISEQGREFIGEGKWFYTLIRTDSTQHWLENVIGYNPNRLAMKGYYWPLNMSLLFPYDNLLTQNPWWAAHPNNN